MPKLKPSEQEESNRIIRACISGNMERQAVNDEYLAARVGVTKQTIQKKRHQPETITVKELQRISKILKFTPLQAASIVLGRELTSKEVKEFILM